MRATEPALIQTDFRVADRSGRVWLYGFVRMIPTLFWLSGIVLMLLINTLVNIPGEVGLLFLALLVILPVVIDRSKILDPVEHINFGNYVIVNRIVSKRSFPAERVLQVEFSYPENEDYDDQNAGRRMRDVTIRFRRAWPARLHATHADAAAIAFWARTHGMKITEEERSSPTN